MLKQHVSAAVLLLYVSLTCRLEDYFCTKQQAGPDRLVNSMIRHIESLPFRSPALCIPRHPLKRGKYLHNNINNSSRCDRVVTGDEDVDDIIRIQSVLSSFQGAPISCLSILHNVIDARIYLGSDRLNEKEDDQRQKMLVTHGIILA